MSVGAAVPPPLHLPQEEQRQEGDGVPLLLQLCQIPRRAAELHRYPSSGYPCKERGGEDGRLGRIYTLQGCIQDFFNGGGGGGGGAHTLVWALGGLVACSPRKFFVFYVGL